MNTKLVATSLFILINLNLSLIAFAQNLSVNGEISIGCPTPVNGAQITLNDGVDNFIRFESVNYQDNSILKNPISSGTQFKISVSDDRGFDPGAGNCGAGFELTIQADPSNQYFDSSTGNNDNKLPVGQDSDNNLEIQGTSWNNSPDIGLIVIDNGSEFSGVSDQNIQGQPANEFLWNSVLNDFNTISLVVVQESYNGQFSIIFENDDINVDIPNLLPVDVYTKNMTISIT
ncbi:hypothetical protein GF376_00420 [Candidatus Peregrinibacteria bacterium]|nr:hypothetical protein [Candidatus Peregrinibacteria bacterium]